MKKAVEQDTLVALIESGAGGAGDARAGWRGLEFEHAVGGILVASAFAPRAGQVLGELDCAGAVLRDGGNPEFERGVLASVGFGTRK